MKRFATRLRAGGSHFEERRTYETVGRRWEDEAWRKGPTGHCIPSELSIQWGDDWEGRIPNERGEKI